MGDTAHQKAGRSATGLSLYGPDLAHIQAAAYGATYRAGYAWLWQQVSPGPLFDIGCGDGTWAAHAAQSGITVQACEPSPFLASTARKKGVNVEIATAIQATIPPLTRSYTAMGEVLCYCTPDRPAQLSAMVHRIAQQASPALLIADLTGPDTPERVSETEGQDWWMRSSVTHDGKLLRRVIETRVAGQSGREVHYQRLYSPSEALHLAQEAGLNAHIREDYGPDCPLLPGRILLIARS